MEAENSISSTKTKWSTSDLTLIAVMTAVLCVLAPRSLPIGPVPISFTNLVLYFTLYLLGTKKTLVTYLVYLLIGIAGLPVFSNFTGGPARLIGPTGGYLIGFFPLILVSGLMIERFWDKWYMQLIGMLVGVAVCYAFGTAWYAYQAGISFIAALNVGVIPFIPGDLAKIAAALIVAPQIRNRMKKAGILKA